METALTSSEWPRGAGRLSRVLRPRRGDAEDPAPHGDLSGQAKQTTVSSEHKSQPSRLFFFIGYSEDATSFFRN